MRVTANGNPLDLADGATVADLLGSLGWAERWVVVERNGEPVRRDDMRVTVLSDGDRLELVRAVAGG